MMACLLIQILKQIMKKIFFLMLLLLLNQSIFAQQPAVNNSIPSAAQQQFNNMFTGSTNPQWWVNNGMYQVSFTVNNVKQQVNYDSVGTMLYTGLEIKQGELPPGVAAAFKAAYTNRTMMEIYKLDRKGVAGYMIKMDGTPVTRLYFDADGSLVTNKTNNW